VLLLLVLLLPLLRWALLRWVLCRRRVVCCCCCWRWVVCCGCCCRGVGYAAAAAAAAALGAADAWCAAAAWWSRSPRAGGSRTAGEKNGKMGVLGSSRSSITSLNFFASLKFVLRLCRYSLGVSGENLVLKITLFGDIQRGG